MIKLSNIHNPYTDNGILQVYATCYITWLSNGNIPEIIQIMSQNTHLNEEK